MNPDGPHPLDPSGVEGKRALSALRGRRGSSTRLGLTGVLALLFATGAQAAEVVKTESGAKLEVSGFYKTFLTGLLLQPETVAAARTRLELLGQPREFVPDGGFLNAHLARASASFRWKELIKVDVAYQLQFSLASDAAFTGGSALSGTVGGTGTGAQRRLVDFDNPLATGAAWRLEHNLDRLAVRIALPFGDLTVGRQVLSWGTGRFWNPTDVLSPFPPTIIDREVRRGFDAVRLAVPLGEVTQLDVLFLPQLKPEDLGGVVRFQTNWKGFDGSLSVGKYVKDLVVGADLVGDLGPVGVHAEGAYTIELLGLGAGPVTVGEHFFRGVIGAEVKPHEKLILLAEYAYNGFGTNDPRELARVLSSPRVIRGEVFGGGKHQAAIAANFMANELLSLNLAVLGNLADPSVLIIPSLEYSFTQTVLVRAGASLPFGARPNRSVYDGLTPQEALVEPTRGLRSEYGSSAWSAFAQVGLYLP